MIYRFRVSKIDTGRNVLRTVNTSSVNILHQQKKVKSNHWRRQRDDRFLDLKTEKKRVWILNQKKKVFHFNIH